MGEWTLKRWRAGGGAHEERCTIVWVDDWDDKKYYKIESHQGLRWSPIDEDAGVEEVIQDRRFGQE